MDQYLSSASLKSLAKGQLLGKYGTVTAAYFIHFICVLVINWSITLLIASNSLAGIFLTAAASFLLSLFSGYFIAGEAYIYLKIACNQTPFVSDLFHFFRGDTAKVLSIRVVTAGVAAVSMLPASVASYFVTRTLPGASVLVNDAYEGAPLFLLFAVLLLAGVIVSTYVELMLSQAFFLMLDFPDYPAARIIQMSIRLMKGNMGRLLYIELSFIPLLLLGSLSCGIGLLWVLPYLAATQANFYLDLVRKKPVSETASM